MIIGILLLVCFEVLFSMGLYAIGVNSVSFILFLILSYIVWVSVLTKINDNNVKR